MNAYLGAPEPWLTHSYHPESSSALESPSSSLSPGLSFWAPHSRQAFWISGTWEEWSGLFWVSSPSPEQITAALSSLGWSWLGASFPLTLDLLAHHHTEWSPVFISPLALLEDGAISPLKSGLLSPGYGNHARVETVLRVTLVHQSIVWIFLHGIISEWLETYLR